MKLRDGIVALVLDLTGPHIAPLKRYKAFKDPVRALQYAVSIGWRGPAPPAWAVGVVDNFYGDKDNMGHDIHIAITCVEVE